MTAEQWSNIESLFADLSALPIEERSRRLAAVQDIEVRDEVASLLEHSAEDGQTVAAAVGTAATRVEPAPQERGQRFGPFRVVRRLGHGGQGAVFEAARDDGGFAQRVAIKIVKWEIDTDATRAQFARERQILAGLEHPNIARLLDGGQREDGTPYLVMEFVEGLPLTAAAAGWTLRRKLEVFLDVMSAVEFAHRNLIVHRDLKPANILVTADGVPKLLDFGIAKLLDVDAQRTQTILMAFTPDYASPEQVRGGPISTASDVYSLGVVLYQLITGRKPYKIETATPLELDRVVCQDPPADPDLGDDLDQILLMALRKEPERRYSTIQQFADDVRRYLDHRPVMARPDSIGYRTRLYVRRHWAILLASAVALTAIVAGTGAALYQASVARQQFQMVRKLAHSFVFDYHDELAKVQGNTAIREKMVRTALEYLDTLSSGARNDASLQQELASAYRKVGDTQGNPSKPNLGHPDDAIASYGKAAGIYGRLGSNYAAEVTEFYSAYTALLASTGHWDDAGKVGVTALAAAEQLAREKPDDEAAQLGPPRIWGLLGDVDDFTSREAESIGKYRKADQLLTPVLTRWKDTAALKVAESTRSRLGTALRLSGQLDESRVVTEEDEKLLLQLIQLAPDDPQFQASFVSLLHDLSALFYDDLSPSMGDAALSLKASRKAVDLSRARVAKDPNDASATLSLAVSLFRLSFPLRLSDPGEAVRVAEESVRLYDSQIAAGNATLHVLTRRARANRRLSQALLSAGRASDARALAGKIVEEQRGLALREEPELKVSTYLALSLADLGLASEAVHDLPGALHAFNEAEQIFAKYDQLNPKDLTSVIPLAGVRRALSEHWRKVGDAAQAQHWFDEAVRVWREFHDQNEYVRREIAKLQAGRRAL